MTEPVVPLARGTAGLLGADLDLTGRLARFAAEARTSEVADARARAHWLRQAATEEANVHGLLVDLAERGGRVVLDTVAGRRYRANVRAVAADFVALAPEVGGDALVSLCSVASIRTDSGTTATADRVIDMTLTLAGALMALTADQPRVLIVTVGRGEHLTGELRAVGRDLVVLRADGDSTTRLYVPIGAVAELVLVQ